MPRLVTSELDEDLPRRDWTTFRVDGARQWLRLLCSHCAARRQMVGRIGVYVRPELPAICVGHRRLLGYYILPHLHEIDLAAAPEILAAYRRHRRLLHRYGVDTVGTAQQQAIRLFRTWTHPARRLKPVELVARWDARADALRHTTTTT